MNPCILDPFAIGLTCRDVKKLDRCPWMAEITLSLKCRLKPSARSEFYFMANNGAAIPISLHNYIQYNNKITIL